MGAKENLQESLINMMNQNIAVELDRIKIVKAVTFDNVQDSKTGIAKDLQDSESIYFNIVKITDKEGWEVRSGQNGFFLIDSNGQSFFIEANLGTSMTFTNILITLQETMTKLKDMTDVLATKLVVNAANGVPPLLANEAIKLTDASTQLAKAINELKTIEDRLEV